MSHTYLVTLTSQEPFFFGGEQTFGADDTRGESSRYSASSTHFPQQTALLGMLRKMLLIKNGNMTMHLKGEWVDSRGKKSGYDENYEKALQLTGKGSFSYENKSDLGSIKEISPIFIKKGDVSYIQDAKDTNYTPNLLNGKTLIFEGYDAKKHEEDTFLGTNNSSLTYDDIFQESTTVGIKKAKDGETNDDGFFQKMSYILKDKVVFAFYLTMTQELSFTDAYVTLGADQSSFKLTLTQTDESFSKTFSPLFKAKTLHRVVLHSETLLKKEYEDLALFILGKRSSYRQLSNKDGKKSKRYYLLERGSVIYTKDLEKLTVALSQPHLQRVGINHFTSIKGL